MFQKTKNKKPFKNYFVAMFLLLSFMVNDSVFSQNSQEYIPYRKGSSWGFVDKDKKVLITPQFEDAMPFLGDYAPVKRNDTWTFINTKGEIQSQHQYLIVETIFDKFFVVRKAFDKSWGHGLLNADLSWGVQPKNGQGVYATSSGLIEISVYEGSTKKSAYLFQNGEAFEHGIPSMYDHTEGMFEYRTENYKYGFMGITDNGRSRGHHVPAGRYNYMKFCFGLGTGYSDDDYWAVFDETGSTLWEDKKYTLKNSSIKNCFGGDKFLIVEKTGQKRTLIKSVSGEEIDITALKLKTEYATELSNIGKGIAFATASGGMRGFLRTDGSFTPIIKGKEVSFSDFRDGLSIVRNGTQAGIIDTTGAFIVPMGTYQYPNFWNYRNPWLNGSYFITSKSNKFGLLNKAGKELIPPKYTTLERTNNPTLFKVEINKKQGYVDINGVEYWEN